MALRMTRTTTTTTRMFFSLVSKFLTSISIGDPLCISNDPFSPDSVEEPSCDTQSCVGRNDEARLQILTGLLNRDPDMWEVL